MRRKDRVPRRIAVAGVAIAPQKARRAPGPTVEKAGEEIAAAA